MPQQSTPQAVFWRRRLLVLAAVIALIWLLMQGVGRLTSESDQQPEATKTPASQRVTTAKDGPVQVRLAAAKGDCDPEKIRVTPSVPTGQKSRGPVKIGLTLSSRTNASCVLQPADADMVAIISAGETAVWDSTRCTASLLTKPVKIAARWSTYVVTEWNGRKSGSACSDREDWVGAGDLKLQVGTLGGEPGQTAFQLDEAPVPPPKPKPKESKSTPKPKPTTDSSAENSR